MGLRQRMICTIIFTVIKVCLDSNIFISAFIFFGKPAKILDLAVEKKIVSITSPQIIAEVGGVLSKKFKQDEKYIKKQLKVISDVSELVIPRNKIRVLKYYPDNKILEAAQQGKVDYIVTGDSKHLLPLKEFRGIPIITPAQFLAVLKIR